ncbi:MAG: 2-phospho-L-lactate transferase [Chloroflexi bacterium]|nr:2-phospho-L-lactate transferase [Chloroflexota bacterium]
MKIAVLCGGVGGAKLADGLSRALPPENLTIIVNTGDDFEHLGLLICPDLDTVCYTLAGIANPETGWGRADESWNALAAIDSLGGPSWFRLGDRDLGTHLERTRCLAQGQTLSQVTSGFCRSWNILPNVIPMSDRAVRTMVSTEAYGELTFQDYFVRRRCEPKVTGFRFSGAEHALPAPGTLEAIEAADAVILSPSNPWVSLDPILALPGIRSAVGRKPVAAVSSIIGGKTVKGPAAKMFQELGFEPSAPAIALHYRDILDGFILDQVDLALGGDIRPLGIQVAAFQTLMNSPADRRRLAEDVLNFIPSIL